MTSRADLTLASDDGAADDGAAGDAAAAAPPELRTVSAMRVRHLIASAWLADVAPPADTGSPIVIGDVMLLPHQAEAVARLRAALDEFGGALLADDTGLGKSYVALAIARGARWPLLVAPAGLRAAWGEALRRTGVRIPFRSAESLGRAAAAPATAIAAAPRHDLVVVDEAHHFRNPRTRRYRRLAALTRGARVLLLSATPVHNRAAELHAQLALFLGAGAASLDDATLARCVVRRGGAVLPPGNHAPRVRGPYWLAPVAQDAVLERLLALPPPLPPSDGGDAGALVVHGLVRRWSSSVGALRGALRRRLARAEALAAALEAGHHPTLAELRRWVVADDAVQLDFPELLAGPRGTAPAMRLLRTVRAHRDAVRGLLDALRAESDAARAAALRGLRARHAGERVVAFSEHADTVDALYRLLARDGGVCALTGSGARVAGGTLSRAEALRRFAPRAHGVAPPPAAERIDLLLSTDVLSEGIGLQDASVVVHLDLPWTPARLEQRVGRVARLGSPHAEVSVYAFMPPAGAEVVLGVERTLRAKLGDAARLVGAPAHALPVHERDGEGISRIAPTPPRPDASLPELTEALRTTFLRWRDDPADARRSMYADMQVTMQVAMPVGTQVGTHANMHADVLADVLATVQPATDPDVDMRSAGVPSHRDAGRYEDVVLVAAAGAPAGTTPGYLALLARGTRNVLLAGELPEAANDHSTDAPPSDAPAALWRVASRAGGRSVQLDAMLARRALAAVASWCDGERSREALDLVASPDVTLRRTLLRHVAAAERAAPRHQRAAVARLAAAARRALAARRGVGTERALAELAAVATADEGWLRAVVDCVGQGAVRDPAGDAIALRALLLVRPDAAPPFPLDNLE
ncbi:MAG TPA: DEAD/DEAH box helicase [Gemmatimonadaceae bacterium]|nr:DEAD/DEAH box helicase [Gemmatimonadaceae bacterium]